MSHNPFGIRAMHNNYSHFHFPFLDDQQWSYVISMASAWWFGFRLFTLGEKAKKSQDISVYHLSIHMKFFFQCWPKILIRRAYGNKRSIYDFAWLRVNKMFCLMFFLRSIYIAMFSGAMTKVQNFSLQCFYKALSAFNTSYYFILKTIFSL